MAVLAFQEGEIARVLLDVHHLIRAHGLDGKGDPPEGKVPLRLPEAIKLAMGEHPRALLIRMNAEQRNIFGAVNWILTARMEQLFPPYRVLNDWLGDIATTETLLSLIENVLLDYGVRP